MAEPAGRREFGGGVEACFFFFLRWSVLVQIIVEELMAWKLHLNLFTCKQTVNCMIFMAHDEKSGALH